MEHNGKSQYGGARMTRKEKAYLRSICKRCKKANGRCIKYDPYVGLCAETDAEELLEGAKRRKII